MNRKHKSESKPGTGNRRRPLSKRPPACRRPLADKSHARLAACTRTRRSGVGHAAGRSVWAVIRVGRLRSARLALVWPGVRHKAVSAPDSDGPSSIAHGWVPQESGWCWADRRTIAAGVYLFAACCAQFCSPSSALLGRSLGLWQIKDKRGGIPWSRN